MLYQFFSQFRLLLWKQFMNFSFSETEIEHLNNDIESSKTYLNSLKEKSYQLEQQLSTEEFRLEEFRSENTFNNDQYQRETLTENLTFIQWLNYLEEKEDAFRKELSNHQETIRSLKHQKNIILQKSHLLNNQFQLKIEELSEILIEKQQNLYFLQQICLDLEKELEKKSQLFLEEDKSYTQQLQIEEKHYQSELLSKKDDLKKLKEQISTQNQIKNENIKKKRRKLEKIERTQNWEKEEIIYNKKQKQVEKNLLIETKNFESLKNRENELKKRFKQLLGEDDPGNGMGQCAKNILQLEIDFINNQESNPLFEEIQMEANYANNLDKQLSLIQRSMLDFEKYRKDKIFNLVDELNSCSKCGYLDLLDAELNSLQNECLPH